MRYNAHIILKYANQWHLTCSQCHTIITLTHYQNFFITPKGNLIPIDQSFTSPFPSGTNSKEPACECRRHEMRFDPHVGKIPWRRIWQTTSVFLPGGSHGQRSIQATVHRIAKSWTWLKQFIMLAMYQPLASTILPSVSMDLPILNISYKLNHIIYGLLCLASLN